MYLWNSVLNIYKWLGHYFAHLYRFTIQNPFDIHFLLVIINCLTKKLKMRHLYATTQYCVVFWLFLVNFVAYSFGAVVCKKHHFHYTMAHNMQAGKSHSKCHLWVFHYLQRFLSCELCSNTIVRRLRLIYHSRHYINF